VHLLSCGIHCWLLFDILCVYLHVIRWVEEDPVEILQSVKTCIEKAVDNLKTLNIDPNCIKGLLTKLLLIIC